MGWKQAASTEGTSTVPLLKIEPNKTVRVRFLDQASCPMLAGTKYEDGPMDVWSHWTPDSLSEQLGGGRSVPCIGPRNGCIFHAEPLLWKASKKNMVNVVEYIGYDAKKKTFDSKRIIGFVGGVKVFQQILTHVQTVGPEVMPGQFDWMISRKGSGRDDTSYTATMLPQAIEEGGIDLNEFEPIETYGDEEIPVLVDFSKINGDVSTPAEQREWYDKLLSSGEEQPTEEAPPSAPPASPGVAKAPIGLQTSAEPKKRGRPPKTPGQETAAVPPAVPPAKAAPVPPKPAAPKVDPYIAAAKIHDPWGNEMGASEHVQFISDADEAQVAEYQITDDMVTAAKAVLVGPAKAAVPPKPAAPPAVKAAPVVAQAEEADDEPGIDELRAQIKTEMQKSNTLKTFAGSKKFFALFDTKALNNVDDLDTLQEMLSIAEGSEEEIIAALNG